MKTEGKKLKRHIISMRVSSEEWDVLHEAMKGLNLQRVSDLMREGLKIITATPQSSQNSAVLTGPNG